MNKTTLKERVAKELDIPPYRADEVVTTVLDAILHGLFTDGRVQFSSFGVFTLRELPPRRARNPQTGETFLAPARRSVRFRATGKLAEALKAGQVITSSRKRPKGSVE